MTVEVDFSKYEYCLHSIISSMAEDKYAPDTIIAFSRGGLVPGVMLSHHFECPLIPLTDMGVVPTIVKAKNILVVDDINDTGSTFLKFHKNVSILNTNDTSPLHAKFTYCAIVENRSSMFKKVKYYGMEIDKSIDQSWVKFFWEGRC